MCGWPPGGPRRRLPCMGFLRRIARAGALARTTGATRRLALDRRLRGESVRQRDHWNILARGALDIAQIGAFFHVAEGNGSAIRSRTGRAPDPVDIGFR